MYKVYVDGQYGTTGLEINNRLEGRADIELLKMDESKRKDNNERARLINTADIVFLCLPDEASREAVSFLENPNTRVIDASTAHRTAEGWVYGIPELSQTRRSEIQTAKKVSNPGCFATGFVALMYPLVSQGIVPADYPVTCNSITGYSGRGKKWIDEFESGDGEILNSPCFYALELNHKHLPEMQKHSGLLNPPIFTPVIANFYRGMTVAVPLYPRLMNKKQNARELCSFFEEYYNGQKFVKVLPFNPQENFELGFLNATACNNTNNLEVLIFGGQERILAVSRLDNLGKGASGAAVQNMNIMLGLNEETGLS
jgi:N-acetyl-gamma-glutamyl-phosphate reductase